jgi:hypothetical protein
MWRESSESPPRGLRISVRHEIIGPLISPRSAGVGRRSSHAEVTRPHMQKKRVMGPTAKTQNSQKCGANVARKAQIGGAATGRLRGRLALYLDFLWSGRRDSNPRPSPWQKNTIEGSPTPLPAPSQISAACSAFSTDHNTPLLTVLVNGACVFCGARAIETCTTCTTEWHTVVTACQTRRRKPPRATQPTAVASDRSPTIPGGP